MLSSMLFLILMPLLIEGFLFGGKKTQLPVVSSTTPSVLAALFTTTGSSPAVPFGLYSRTTAISSLAPITERCGTVSYQGSPNNYYCGSFSSKRRHGFGIRTFGDGSTYLGDYRLDGVTGVGYWLEKNSSRYLGDIVLKQKEGNGYFLWANGDSYMGSWHANKMHGEGIFWSKNANQVYIGSFAHGVKSGHGTLLSTDGNVIFKGLFFNDHPAKI